VADLSTRATKMIYIKEGQEKNIIAKSTDQKYRGRKKSTSIPGLTFLLYPEIISIEQYEYETYLIQKFLYSFGCNQLWVLILKIKRFMQINLVPN